MPDEAARFRHFSVVPVWILHSAQGSPERPAGTSLPCWRYLHHPALNPLLSLINASAFDVYHQGGTACRGCGIPRSMGRNGCSRRSWIWPRTTDAAAMSVWPGVCAEIASRLHRAGCFHHPVAGPLPAVFRAAVASWRLRKMLHISRPGIRNSGGHCTGGGR